MGTTNTGRAPAPSTVSSPARAILTWRNGPNEPPELCVLAGSDEQSNQIEAILSTIPATGIRVQQG